MKSCKEGENDGIITAGPTQAVIVGAHIIIKRIEQMSRVALCPLIPSVNGKHKLMLDVGANVELRPEHLEELAIYATVAAKVIFGVESPRVGLLNIGTEPGKGREVDQLTYERLMANQQINFIGNVETKEVLTADCEILLTDGFTGNMVMKTIEGTAKGTGMILTNCIKSSLMGKIGYLFMRKNLKQYKKMLSADDVGGAMLCGVNVPLVKAHGSSDAFAFFCGIRRVRELIESNLIQTVVSLLPKKDEGNETE
jgi:glycerol-3-phosphate acyltransferase PlsX